MDRLASRLARRGWLHQIPVGAGDNGKKIPIERGWQEKAPIRTFEGIDRLVMNYPAAGVGYVCGCGDRIIAVDCDREDIAEDALELSQQILGYSPFQRRGNPNRWLTLYRAPEGKPIPSHRPAGLGFDIISDRHQFVAYGQHRIGGRYHWVDKAQPLNASPDDVPVVAFEQIKEFTEEGHKRWPTLVSKLTRDTSGRNPLDVALETLPIAEAADVLIRDSDDGGRHYMACDVIWRLRSFGHSRNQIIDMTFAAWTHATGDGRVGEYERMLDHYCDKHVGLDETVQQAPWLHGSVNALFNH